VLALSSAFRKLKNLYAKVVPIFEDYGFTPPSAGVIARDLSEKIEKAPSENRRHAVRRDKRGAELTERRACCVVVPT